MTKRFCSPTETPLHIALTSGHTAVVTPDGTDLDTMFHREAIARGALLTEGATAEDRTQVFNRQIVLRDTIQAMIVGKNKDDFTGDGKPNLVKLKAKTGFQVSREEADAVFAELSSQSA